MKIEKEEFDLLFDRALLLCGARPDNDNWEEQRREWFKWFGSRYDADTVRRGFPLMLKALDPEKHETLPSFVRMRAVCDQLLSAKKRVGRTCDLCNGEGTLTIVRVSDEAWMQKSLVKEDEQGMPQRHVRCVCEAGARAHDSIRSVAPFLPLAKPAWNTVRPGMLTKMVRECMDAGARGATEKELNAIAEKYLKEKK